MSEFSHLSEKVSSELLTEAQVYSVVLHEMGDYEAIGEIRVPEEISDPYSLDLSQFIPNQPLRYEGFVDLVGRVIEDAQAREQIIASERVKLVQEYNPEAFAELGDEVITMKILSREPAKLSRDGKSRPNRGFSMGYEYMNPTEPNKVLCIDRRPIDHKVEITPWAKTSTLANRRALWLERLLISQRWAFTSKGVNPFNWLSRNMDTMWSSSAGIRLHQRPMQFHARMWEYTIMAYPTIREFQLEVKASLS